MRHHPPYDLRCIAGEKSTPLLFCTSALESTNRLLLSIMDASPPSPTSQLSFTTLLSSSLPVYSVCPATNRLWKIKNAKYQSTIVKRGHPTVDDLREHVSYIKDPYFTSAVSDHSQTNNHAAADNCLSTVRPIYNLLAKYQIVSKSNTAKFLVTFLSSLRSSKTA